MQLQFATLAPDVWTALGTLPRSGWVMRGIKDPETVADHTVDLLNLADQVVSQMPDFRGLRRDHLMAMLEVHEWPESNQAVGDESSHVGDPAKRRAERYRRKKKAMEAICGPLGSAGIRIFYLWQRFELVKDEVAKLARALDEYQAIERAFRYEHEGKGPKGLGLEFLQNSLPIEHPILKARFAERCMFNT